MALFSPHQEDLARSGLTPETIQILGIRDVPPHELQRLGGKYNKVTSAYGLRYFNLDGTTNGFERLKLFPGIEDQDGHTIKYYQAPGTEPHLYLPPLYDWQHLACHPAIVLLITEGEKKAAAMCQAGLPCMGVGGVWNWRVKVDGDQRMVMLLLDQFQWEGRPVDIIPDSDGWRKEKLFQVLGGFFALGMELVQRGARVRMIVLPELGGQKVGLDDWLVKEHTFWQVVWEKLERIPLDDKRLRKLAKWYQQWQAKNLRSQVTELTDPTKQGEELPTIYIPEELSRLRVQAAKALLKRNVLPRLFRRGDMLCRIENTGDGARLQHLNVDRLRHELAWSAHWHKVSEKNIEGCSPPTDVVRDLLSTPPPDFPLLNRIVHVPTFAADGTLVETPGYHPDATMYLDLRELEVLPIPDEPSEEDIRLAKEWLYWPLQDFPFVSASDRAHALGLCLLPLARELIPGCTPLHLIEAPCPGSGKGLLTDAVLLPAIGHAIKVCAEARNDEEWRKRLTACFRENQSVLLLDNISRPVDSGVLSAALTATTWTDRLLGKNETLSLPVRCLWVMTANNPIITTEIARRSIRIRLDPHVDRPWLREGFGCGDLRGWVRTNQPSLIWSGLTLIRSWIVAGRPAPPITPLGSFEEWSQVIGGILHHVGIGGFLGNLPEFYEVADQEGTVWRTFFQEWWGQFGEKAVGVAELYPLAEATEGLPLGRGQSERAMKAALGKQLQKHRDRIIGDFRLVYEGTVSRATQWKLEGVGSPESGN